MRYLAHFFISALLLALTLAGFNFWVDPYGIYTSRGDDSLTSKIMSERIFKTVKLVHAPADVVFIGTSRTDIGMGHQQPALVGKRLVNLAIFDQRIQETRRLFEIIAQDGKHQTVVIGLDFFAFNMLNPAPADYVEDNYNPLRSAILLLSISSMTDALAKLRQPQAAGGDCCDIDGFRIPSDASYRRGKYHYYFSTNERSYFVEKYLPYPQCSFSFASQSQRAKTSLSELRFILELAHRRNVDLRMFISPSHARQWETLAAAGLWDSWEAWKRQLVALNEDVALQAGHTPLPLWDFSGYDEVSNENLPNDEDPRIMSNYTDSAHFTPAVGQRVVSRIFGNRDEWGVPLGHANIEADLTHIRSARLHYRANHLQDVAEIEALAQETTRTKHCPNNVSPSIAR